MTPPKHDIIALIDIPASLGLLTRLPIKVDTEAATKRGARAGWAYPIAGLVVTLLACAVTAPLLWLGLPVQLGAALLLACQIILTGALHEDGLADTADGFWGGWKVERRLAIMKDSQIGSYGTLALILSVLLRWQALVLILPHSIWAAPIAAAMLSRAPMVALMAALRNARMGGLSQSVGRPTGQTASIAAALAFAVALLLLGPAVAVTLTALTGLATILCGIIAQAKIKGQTGDILGATQQVTEITLLAALAGLLG